MRDRFISGVAAAAWLWTTSAAQTPPEPIRATTHLVEVSVTAHSKQGEPVTGLTQDDFQLFDEGVPQRIAHFRVETPQPSATPQRKLPPGMFTNRLDAGSATVILFDGLNTRLIDQPYAREQILKFLRQLKPGERVALYAMGRGPRVLQEFTDDSSALIRALAAYRGGMAASLAAPLHDPATTGAEHFDAWMGELTFGLYDYYTEDRAFRTVRALTAIASHLEQVPGRKNLIWVSGSFPISLDGDSVAVPRRTKPGQRDSWPEVERASRALGKVNLAIYPVDARGLIAAQQYGGALSSPQLRNPDTSEIARMQALADRTGGRAFFNNNDLSAALSRALDDSRVTYVVGYYPLHTDWKGRFHKLDLRVNRSGTELHYRRGYFAQPVEPSDSWYREQVLNASLWNPVDATGLRLTVAVRPSLQGGIDLAIQIDPRDITFQSKGDRRNCALDVWLVQLDQQEKLLKTKANTNNLSLDQATFERVLQVKGLALAEQLIPELGAALLRVLVRDVASGTIGTLTVPLRSVR
ncbi:MAG TPA: VWA domain-containing protein [Paludibaculum sp.]|jgi:VWFA-related protein